MTKTSVLHRISEAGRAHKSADLELALADWADMALADIAEKANPAPAAAPAPVAPPPAK